MEKKDLEEMTFNEQIVFELEKDKCICTTEMESRWRKFDNIDTKKIYRNIVNYRINKFGSSSVEVAVKNKTREECLRDADKVRRYWKRRLFK